MIRERASIEKNWQQRIERTRIAASRAERQYHAAEPENRLVAVQNGDHSADAHVLKAVCRTIVPKKAPNWLASPG